MAQILALLVNLLVYGHFIESVWVSQGSMRGCPTAGLVACSLVVGVLAAITFRWGREGWTAQKATKWQAAWVLVGILLIWSVPLSIGLVRGDWLQGEDGSSGESYEKGEEDSRWFAMQGRLLLLLSCLTTMLLKALPVHWGISLSIEGFMADVVLAFVYPHGLSTVRVIFTTTTLGLFLMLIMLLARFFRNAQERLESASKHILESDKETRSIASTSAALVGVNELHAKLAAWREQHPDDASGLAILFFGLLGASPGLACLIIYYANGGNDARCNTAVPRFLLVSGWTSVAVQFTHVIAMKIDLFHGRTQHEADSEVSAELRRMQSAGAAETLPAASTTAETASFSPPVAALIRPPNQWLGPTTAASDGLWGESSSHPTARCLKLLTFPPLVFLFVWWILGNAWVWNTQACRRFEEEEQEDCCDAGMWEGARSYLIFTYIFLGVSCCCSVCISAGLAAYSFEWVDERSSQSADLRGHGVDAETAEPNIFSTSDALAVSTSESLFVDAKAAKQPPAPIVSFDPSGHALPRCGSCSSIGDGTSVPVPAETATVTLSLQREGGSGCQCESAAA